MNPTLGYGRWQLRDHLRGAGLVIALFGVAMGVILWRVRVANPGLADAAGPILGGTLGQIAWPLVILAVSGIVSTDRIEGYNRALFSTPVVPAWFYLQRFLIGGAIIATLPLVIAVVIRIAAGSWADPIPSVAGVALLYLLLGGLVFAWSTFGRRDWAIGLSVYLGQSALHGAKEAGLPFPRWLLGAEPYLPPFHLVEFGRMEGAEFLPASLPAGADLIHYLLYALALIATGLIVLRLRPMGGGGRG
jgi:hypothetical protein